MMIERGETKVTVNKEVLLGVLRKNRDAHAEAFTEADTAFKAAYLLELKRWLRHAKKGDFKKTAVSIRAPQPHVKEYDRAIQMLEMSVSDQVTMSEHMFQMYVNDEWEWKQKFITDTMAYGRPLTGA